MWFNSLGNNTAEEWDIKSQVLWQAVETTHGSEVNQAVGRLLTVLNWYTTCGDQERRALRSLTWVTITNVSVAISNVKWTVIFCTLYCTCSADLNRGDGYCGLDVRHFKCRQTGDILGFTLSSQQLQTFTTGKTNNCYSLYIWILESQVLYILVQPHTCRVLAENLTDNLLFTDGLEMLFTPMFPKVDWWKSLQHTNKKLVFVEVIPWRSVLNIYNLCCETYSSV